MESATKITEKIGDVGTGKSGKRDSFHSLMIKVKMLPMSLLIYWNSSFYYFSDKRNDKHVASRCRH